VGAIVAMRGSERVEGIWLAIFERIEAERYVEG